MENLEEILHAFHCKKPIWFFLLANAVEEERQIVMVVHLRQVHFPVDTVPGTTRLEGQRQVTPLVILSKLEVQLRHCLQVRSPLH